MLLLKRIFSRVSLCSWFHCSSKHQTLSFPFRHFFYRLCHFHILFLILLLDRFLFLSFLIIFWRSLILILFLSFIFNLPLFFNVKLFPFLDKNFLANFLMFAKCLFIKFSPTTSTLDPIIFFVFNFFIISTIFLCKCACFVLTRWLILVEILGIFYRFRFLVRLLKLWCFACNFRILLMIVAVFVFIVVFSQLLLCYSFLLC